MKELLLNKIYKDYNISSELYYQLLTSIKFDNRNDMEEINDFVEEQPHKLKIRLILAIYKNTYEKIDYL